ncbi:hypothetical protein CCH79_00013147 [Gambusia affinis]|uniref:Ig-like domain-containing protein n=1 Tax=Gambusia affinis TaxID=33528 RepID=A0A315WS73_GAMAF|nr:hypothetical protein CCH79_00013147 [Gambusia affinis]
MRTMKKMASLLSVCVFLLCCSAAVASRGCDQLVAVGGDVDQPDGTKHYDTIHYKWLQNGNLISNATEISMTRKVAETENLLVSCEVGNQVSSATSDSLTHTCIGPVKKPEINVSCKDSEAIFICLAAQQPDDAQYRWLRDGEVVINQTKMSLTMNSVESKNMNFSCEVYNQARSEKSVSLSHRCVVSTFLGLPEELFGISIWIYIGGGAGLLVLIIIIITVCCVRCKKKRGKNDEAELEYRAGQSSSSAYCAH